MTYTDTLPTSRDTARFLLGDTSNSAGTELLTDAAIDAVLVIYAPNPAVAFLATGLASRFAQKPSDVALPHGLRVAWRERIAAWLGLAAQMRAGGVVGPIAVAPWVGGVGITEKRTVEQATDRVRPAFRRDTDLELPPLMDPQVEPWLNY
jgi:hypothetical protein